MRMPAPVRALLGEYAGATAASIGAAAALTARAAARARRDPQHDLFPAGRLDQDLQQVDLRDRNSWRLMLAEVPTVELLETQLVNAVAPFVLNARLKPLMLRTPERDKHVVNVVGGGRAVLPAVQDHEAPAHEHGQGRAQHDDAHRARRSTTPTAST